MNFNDDSPHSPFPFKDNVAAGEERKKGGNLAEISLRDLGLARTEDPRPMIFIPFSELFLRRTTPPRMVFSHFCGKTWRKGRDSGGRSCSNCIMFFLLLVYRFGNMWEKEERWFYIFLLNILHTMV